MKEIEIIYDYNQDSFKAKKDGNYKRMVTRHEIFDTMNKTDWESEAKYHNSYHRKEPGRPIRLKK